MKILGIDPGATIGWCFYDSAGRRVIRAGSFRDGDNAISMEVPQVAWQEADVAVLERPKGYGPTRPQLVECGIVFGDLRRKLRDMYWGTRGLYGVPVQELLRLEVCQILTGALHGVIRVRNDATAWAALLELHGGAEAGKKGGPLHGVTSHARAALAVAVALALRADPEPGFQVTVGP